MNHYYVVASLPPLILGESIPFSPEEFFLQCCGMLSDSEKEDLDAVIYGREHRGHSSFARQWSGVNTQLHNAIASHRASHYGIEAKPYIKPHTDFSMSIEHLVNEAFAHENPLTREMHIDHGIWHLVDDLSRDEPFGFAKILAFVIKLKIAKKWSELNDETGQKNLEQFITQQTDEIINRNNK